MKKGVVMSDIMAEVTRSIFFERESDVKHPTFDREIALYILIAEGKLEQVKPEVLRIYVRFNGRWLLNLLSVRPI